MGYDLNDIIFPLSLQKSKNQEAKYLVDYVDTDLHFLPQSAATSQDLSSDMSGSLSAANSLRVGDQQQQFLDMIDKGTVELQQSVRDLRSNKVDALQQTVNDAMVGLPLPPLKSRTSVVKAALYLIDSGVLNIPILNIINVKQARAFLWNALWLQDVMNHEWGLAKADEDALSLANGFQLALMGPGGTGKTAVLRVTEALITYFCGPDSVRKCAPTNAAARLIGGDTVHAACKLPFVDVPTSSSKARLRRAVLDRHRQEWPCDLSGDGTQRDAQAVTQWAASVAFALN